MRMMLADFGIRGVNKDRAPYTLESGYLSDVNGFVFSDGRLQSAKGYIKILDTPQVAPYFALAINEFWLYAGLEKIYVINDTGLQENITRQDGVPADVDYTGTEQDVWTGFAFNGCPIFCNGVDAPQCWPVPLATSKRMEDIAYDPINTWADLNYNANVLKPFRNY